jgi:predicted phage terminase large subunit-like protein
MVESQHPLDANAVKALKQQARESLFFLARGILGFEDLDPAIHLPICRKLEKYEENTRLGIVLPRSWFKSTIGSVAYPIWRAINNPNVRILVVQNSHSNACKKLNEIKQIFEQHELFRALFPEILPTSRGVWTKECLTVNRTLSAPEGTFEAAGTGTAVTSRHYDCIIEDDTVSPDLDAMTGIVQQPTQLEIEKAIGWHRLAYPLLLHPRRSQRIVIGTRWAERDLIGWVLEHSRQFKWMSRKAIEDGKVAWSRFDQKTLDELQELVGPYMFGMLYLNEPVAAINQIFKREWLEKIYYQNLKKGLIFCTSVDLASAKETESSDPDYNVIMTTGIRKATGDVYVARYDRTRGNPGEVIDTIFSHNKEFKSLVTRLEAISYQRTLMYWMMRRQNATGIRFYIEPVKGLKGSKEDRIRALQPYFQAGKVHIRTSMGELERELLAFPKGAHDDLLDGLALQVPFWDQEFRQAKKEKEEETKDNVFSGAAILDELHARVEKLHTYPADIGLMKERFENGLPRKDYVYAKAV